MQEKPCPPTSLRRAIHAGSRISGARRRWRRRAAAGLGRPPWPGGCSSVGLRRAERLRTARRRNANGATGAAGRALWLRAGLSREVGRRRLVPSVSDMCGSGEMMCADRAGSASHSTTSHTRVEREEEPRTPPPPPDTVKVSSTRLPTPPPRLLWHCRACSRAPHEPTVTLCGHLFCRG